uniref:Uncharacterized protein n=1 Tax=Octopus bimaculoides TaxID=37653 RepID=A0A0L8GHS9_OCTBM
MQCSYTNNSPSLYVMHHSYQVCNIRLHLTTETVLEYHYYFNFFLYFYCTESEDEEQCSSPIFKTYKTGRTKGRSYTLTVPLV